jgi:tetratricopeptide (TPR) repeat protein
MLPGAGRVAHTFTLIRPWMTRTLVISAVLIIATVAAYGEVVRFDFVAYDDPEYVTENKNVANGLTAAGVAWVLTSEHVGNWHPVTGLSHMLDCQLFGLDPAAHHLMNLALHVTNALVLFAVLRFMTGAPYPSALVAALFAVHPLHVESVAWISQRKDVLSTLFALLSMGAYATYAKRGGSRRYLAATVLFALALMAKPMVVTLPFVFLLLDYWPLGRIRLERARGSADRETRPASDPRQTPGTLILEKMPLMLLSAGAGILTLLAQRSAGALRSADTLPVGPRLINAVVAYVQYLAKAFWPSDLGVLYPHPYLPGGTPWSARVVVGAGVMLVVITGIVVSLGRRYAVMGWLWYLGMLVPVLGVVQVGSHAMADRYTYLPLVGLFIMIAWGGADCAEQWPRLRPALVLVAAALVLAGIVATRAQARHWRTSDALFTRALTVAPRNPPMLVSTGNLRRTQDRMPEAIDLYRTAAHIHPGYVAAHNNLCAALPSVGELEAALDHCRRALELDPRYADAHNNMGTVLRSLGRFDAAIDRFRHALRIEPENVLALNNLAGAFQLQGRLDEAIDHYRRALEIDPRYAQAHANLGIALQLQGNLPGAIHHYEQALEIHPTYTKAHVNLGAALQSQGRLDEAISHYREALRLSPGHSEARAALEHLERPGDAIGN